MQPGDFSDAPNPFALGPSVDRRPKRRAVASALKFLLLVVVALAILLVLGSQTKKWLANRLLRDFDTLSSEDQQTRLIQLSELGSVAIDPLVQTLAVDNLEVARTAYNLLRQSQNDWTVLGLSERQQRHAAMVDAIESIAVYLPDDRTGWASSLLQQTMLATVQRSDEGSRQLYRDATHAIDVLSLSDRAGPSILSDDPIDPLAPRRLTVRSEPLPVGSVAFAEDWTDWPPRPSQTATAKPVADDDPVAVEQSPSVYRSSASTLQPVEPDEPVILRSVRNPRETAYQVDQIQSVTHLVDSPMETIDDKSVIHWLGSPHQSLREQAREELLRRGFSETALSIAAQIASGSVSTRLELIDKISRSDQLDPRGWLLMMLNDEHRDVRLSAVSVLATMNDPEIQSRLRTHLVEERDLLVGAKIRRVLNLR